MSGGGATATFGVAEAINRGYNMLVATTLGLAGLAFGSLIFEENDLADKIDNTILVIVAAVAVIWYFVGNNAHRRSSVPLALAGVALLGQIAGIFLEFADPAALGDDIGGMVLYVPLLIIAAFLYSKNGRLIAAAASSK